MKECTEKKSRKTNLLWWSWVSCVCPGCCVAVEWQQSADIQLLTVPTAHPSTDACLRFRKKQALIPQIYSVFWLHWTPFLWPIQCHPIQLFLLLLLLRSSSRPEGAVKVCGITVQHRPGEGAGMSSCVWSIVLHLWHLYLSPLYDVLDHTNIWSC